MINNNILKIALMRLGYYAASYLTMNETGVCLLASDDLDPIGSEYDLQKHRFFLRECLTTVDDFECLSPVGTLFHCFRLLYAPNQHTGWCHLVPLVFTVSMIPNL